MGDEDPALQPLDVDGVRAVAAGTIVWAVLAVVAFALRDRLEAAGHGWWIWVCVAGAGLGLLGLLYVIRRARAYSASAGPATTISTSATDAGSATGSAGGADSSSGTGSDSGSASASGTASATGSAAGSDAPG